MYICYNVCGDEIMYNYHIGDKFIIHSYKHDGNIHRSWDEAILLEETEEYMVFGNNKTKVIESDGRNWRTKEPAIMFFYKKEWYNVIGQLKEDGIYFYCNIASPFVIEDKTIKYIDYDLDLRVFPDGAFKILDRGEYKYHKKIMDYPDSIDKIVKESLSDLIEIVRRKDIPFDIQTINQYHDMYNKLKRKVTKK